MSAISQTRLFGRWLTLMLALGAIWPGIHAAAPGNERRPPAVVVRFAHSQLEPAVIAAFDELAASYMARNPGVIVEQLAVPPRLYRSWIRTQLIGGTAPQLIELTPQVTQDLLFRFFLPLTSWIQRPNPHNAGTALEGVPWQRTFRDNLNTKPNYSDVLVQHYGIPSTFLTRRLLYNRNHLLRLTGSVEPPRTLAALRTLGARARSEGLTRGGLLAASAEHVEALLEYYVGSATHALKGEVDPTMRRTGWDFEPAHGYLRGEWSFSRPEIRGALDGLAALGELLPQGAGQASPQDAAFAFLQGAVTGLLASTGEAAVLRGLASFPVVVGSIPLPAEGDPGYGPWFSGPPSEADLRTVGSFGLVRGAPHRDETVDFLHWMSSVDVHRAFVARSGWNPVVRTVPTPEATRAFTPLPDGYPTGLRLGLFGAEAGRLALTQLHRLLGPQASSAQFIAALEPAYGMALRQGWLRNVQIEAGNIARLDVTFAASLFGSSEGDAAERAELLADLRADLELTHRWTEHALARNFSARPTP